MRTVKSAERRTRPARTTAKGTDISSDQGRSVSIPLTAFTLAGFREWVRSETMPEHGQIFFLGDEIYVDMSPERLGSHGAVKTELTRVLANIVVAEELGEFYADGASVANEPAGLSNEPDAVFVSYRSFETGRVRLVPTADGKDAIEIEGPPDWVLEVVSPSSVGKDTKKLLLRYHTAGIPEYWLVDARGDEIDFQVLVRAADGYRPAARRGGWRKSPVFGHSFRLTRRRDRVGQWEYRLEAK